MAEPIPKIPELPLFAQLLRRLSSDAHAEPSAKLVRGFLPGLRAGLSSFRPRTADSAGLLRAHAFEYGARGKQSVGAKAAALVAQLSPCLALEEAQTYLLLRRAFGTAYGKQSFSEETAKEVCAQLFAERTAAAFLPAQLAALAGPSEGDETAEGSLGEAVRLLVCAGGEGEGEGGYGGAIGRALLAALQRAAPVRPNAFEFAVLEEAWEEQARTPCRSAAQSALPLSNASAARIRESNRTWRSVWRSPNPRSFCPPTPTPTFRPPFCPSSFRRRWRACGRPPRRPAAPANRTFDCVRFCPRC